MLKIKDNKIQLICYTADGIYYERNRDLKKYCLVKPLKFVPYELMFNEEEMKLLLDVCLNKNPRLKITIERLDSDNE